MRAGQAPARPAAWATSAGLDRVPGDPAERERHDDVSDEQWPGGPPQLPAGQQAGGHLAVVKPEAQWRGDHREHRRSGHEAERAIGQPGPPPAYGLLKAPGVPGAGQRDQGSDERTVQRGGQLRPPRR